MNKKLLSILSVLVIVAFIGYMIYDAVHSENISNEPAVVSVQAEAMDMWLDTDELKINEGTLKAVAAADSMIYLGGSSFVSGYKKDLKLLWTVTAPEPVTSLSCYNDTIYASTIDQILIFGKDGKLIKEWGPFEKNSIITSVSAGKKFIAFADAGNRTVFVLDKGGEVKKMIGGGDNQFVIPSAYFDLAMNGDEIYVANPGHRRIETRNAEGTLVSYFGEAGTAPEAFCGCCNPAHFALIPGGFITAEKGINRIKILNKKGEFVEFVSSVNDFTPAMPLDIASSDGLVIYAANMANSTLYVFKRK